MICLVSIVGALTWFSWPRPDLEIRIATGGQATIIDHMGRPGPLTDTLFVGGAGARRTVRIVNADSVRHVLAMFTVEARAQTEYTVPPGTFGGYCSAHLTSKHLTVVVR